MRYIFNQITRCILLLAIAITSSVIINSPIVSAFDDSIIPIDWARFTTEYPTDSNALLQKEISEDALRYALKTWYPTKYGSQIGEYLSFSGVEEANIRYPAMVAVGIATALKLDTYNDEYIGLSKDDAREICIKLVKSLAFRHLTTTSGGWGNKWQSSLWSASAGFAGWLIFDEFSVTDKENIKKMIEYEANRLANYTVPYYRNKSGTIVFSGDSKAEENAWDSNILHLACVMMPGHKNYAAWSNKGIELSISAFSRPSDTTNNTIINGKPISEWLNGSNAEENGTVVNHNLIHPDYMGTISINIMNALFYTLAGEPTPEAVFFNAEKVYAAMVDLNFSSPPHRAPGGTIYIDDTFALYFPQGNDWGTGRYVNYGTYDAEVHAFGLDSLASQKGDYWEALHIQKAIEMQDRHADGHMYASNAENSYGGREEQTLFENAEAMLSKWVVLQDEFTITDKAPSAIFDNYEGFEKNFNAWTAAGTPTKDTTITHRGAYSYAIDEDLEYLTRILGMEYNQKVDIWYYDDPSQASVECGADVFSGTEASRFIGVKTAESENTYVYGLNNEYFASNVGRTKGWHRFTWDYTSKTDCKMYIDNHLITSVTGITVFDTIKLGDFWESGITAEVYFDDISIYVDLFEGFENDFSKWTATGTPTKNTLITHSGGGSYEINEPKEHIYYSLGANCNQRIDMWYYDDAADTSVECVGTIYNESNVPRMLGVVTSISPSKYVYRTTVNYGFTASSVTRSTGWHKFTWDCTSGIDCKMYIDDILVSVSTGLTNFNSIRIGDMWDSCTSASYFDDITVYANHADPYNVKLISDNGNVNLPAVGDTLNVVFTGYNWMNEGEKIHVSAAMYDENGIMKNVFISQYDIPGGLFVNCNEIEFDKKLTVTDDIKYIRVFIWKDLTDIYPLNNAFECKIY